MNVLVVNCGSSSIKYSLFRMAGAAASDPSQGSGQVLVATGLVERIGESESRIVHTAGAERAERRVAAADHRAAFALVLEALTSGRGAKD
jgi:acetate kinase